MTQREKQPFRPDCIAFLEGTSPDEMRLAIRQMANEAEGLCPNGCGPIVWDDPHNRHCPICHFVGRVNVARDIDEQGRER